MGEMQVWSLGWEDPLEKEVAIHSSILAWETPWTEEPGGLQSMGSQKSHTWLKLTRLLCPWNFPGKNTGVGCHFLSRGSSWPRDQTQVSCIAGKCFNLWATREAQCKNSHTQIFFNFNLLLPQRYHSSSCVCVSLAFLRVRMSLMENSSFQDNLGPLSVELRWAQASWLLYNQSY